MKRTTILALTAILIFSCSKEKEASIVGEWIEEAVYSQGINGYEWQQASSAREYLTIESNSQYMHVNERCGNSISSGSYQYNQSRRELKLKDQYFNSESTYNISMLDQNHIILENQHTGNVYRKKTKFRRQ